MSDIAVNDKGDAMRFNGQAWEPAPVAANDKGERMVHDGQSWRPLAGPQAAARTTPNEDPGGSGVPAMPKNMAPQPRPSHASDWVGSRLVNTATGLLGIPRALTDLTDAAGQKLGLGNALSYANPVTAGQKVLQNIHPALSPSTEDMRGFVKNKIGMPTVNTPGPAGPIVDAGVETALGGASGGPRAIAPMFLGGATSEAGGELTKGTPWEPVARAGGAIAGGGLPAITQNVAGNAGKAVTNTFGAGARNVDQQAGRIIGNALARDSQTAPGLSAAHEGMPSGTPLFVAGGPNVKGALRGSTAAPGPARTTIEDAQQNFRDEMERLKVERSTASTPAYEAAGVPKRPQGQFEYTAGPEGKPVTGGLNTPIVKSEKIDGLLADSADIKAAISAARRLPDFKDLPANSMAMLDKAYKHLGGLEGRAVRAGNNARARDIGIVKRDLRDAITEVNPQYGEALDTFADASKALNQHEKTTVRAFRDVTSGSRTTPMALEAADNADHVSAGVNALRGNFGRAAMDLLRPGMGRIAQGRTEAVNARIAEMLTQTDPKQVGLVNALLEQQRLGAIGRQQGRRNALTYGAGAPAIYAGSNQ